MICGQMKLAIVIQILGGGSYLDMVMVFMSTFNHANTLFIEVVNSQLCHLSRYLINVIAYVKDDERMAEVVAQFAESSGGFINRCLGAIDGWVVNIKKPTKTINTERDILV